MFKKLIALFIIIVGCFFIYTNDLFSIDNYHKNITIPEDNQYKLDLQFLYVQNTNDFIPTNKKELLNIYYTIINSGWDSFTFYCSKEYKDCIKDVKDISIDDYQLSHSNSFVHPYNSYETLYTTYYPSGKVNIEVSRYYNEEKIIKINKEIDNLFMKLVDPKKDISLNIEKIHDYLILNTEYDILKIKDINDKTYQSHNAYGTLFEGYAVCSGYTDTMSLFLYKLNIPNIKIATENHVWNLIYLNNKWLHLDLTWDNPLDKVKILQHSYFLIDTLTLNERETLDHKFDLTIYKEAK